MAWPPGPADGHPAGPYPPNGTCPASQSSKPAAQVGLLSFTIAGMHSDRVQLGDGVGRQGQGRAGDVLAQVIDR
jgi:hypothetical protein